jgi:hypothetical protein
MGIEILSPFFNFWRLIIMEENERIYKVYKHILPMSVSGKENDMVYIGLTSINPEDRWRNGLGYWNNKYFYNVIKKYGWNSFEHIIVADGLTKTEAEYMEIDLIQKYNSADRLYGYNIELGGNSFGKHSVEVIEKIKLANGKPVMCIETEEYYHSIVEAMEITKISSIKKHLLGEFDYAGKLMDGTKLHWVYCDEDICKEYTKTSVAIPSYCVTINGVHKKATEVTIDDLYVLIDNFANENNRLPLMRECTLDNNLPQQRIVAKLLKENNLTYNDFLLQFGKTSNVRSAVENYDLYVQKFVETCKEIGRSLTRKELTNNSFGLPNANFFTKHCPSISVKTYTDFVKWCGLIPSVKYFDKEMVGQNLIKLENDLQRPVRVTDIIPDNCGFSYQLVTKYYGNLGKAKQELNLMK